MVGDSRSELSSWVGKHSKGIPWISSLPRVWHVILFDEVSLFTNKYLYSDKNLSKDSP